MKFKKTAGRIFGYTLKKLLPGAAAGFWFGACPLSEGIYPFGIALLCACAESLPAVYAGVAASALLFGRYPAVTLLAASYVLFVRLLTGRSRPSPLWEKLLLACSASACLAVRIFLGGESLAADIPGAVCVLLIPPLFTFLFAYPVGGGAADSMRRGMAFLAAGFVAARATANIMVFGVPVSVCVAATLTVLACRRRRFPFGGAAGFVFALAGPVSAVPTVGIFGLVAGLFFAGSPVFALIIGYMISVSAGAYLLSFEGIIPVALALAAGIVLYIPLSFLRLPDPAPDREEEPLPIGQAAMAKAFSSLSGLFYTVSDGLSAPSRGEAYDAVRKRVDAVCSECGGCDRDRGDLAALLAFPASEGRMILPEELPEGLRNGCPHCADLAFAANGCVADRTDSARRAVKALGEEYLAFSQLLSGAARRAEEEALADPELEKKVAGVLSEMNVYFSKIRVTGRRMRTVEVFGVMPDSIRVSSKELSRAVAAAVGRCMTAPEFIYGDDRVTLRLRTRPALRTECVKLVSVRDGESLCGDTVSCFDTPDGCFCAVIADGMGSGRDASVASRLAAIYLEKLLSAGADSGDVLRLLGDTLAGSDSEVFTTVDLLEADRICARAKMVKSGAAPSFLLRGEKQYEIRSRTPPLGIIKSVSAEQTVFSLRRGDIVLMLSDGVPADRISISSAFAPGVPLREAASRLMASASGTGESSDDMSVCAVRFY